MITETLRRLHPFGTVADYRYVGFGSIGFVDFLLFHKMLGIHQMVSIERKTGYKSRLEFNRPLTCIDIRIGPASEILLDLPWDAKTVLWLDYEGPLQAEFLGDLQFAFGAVQPGSVVMLTVLANSLVTEDLQLAKTPEVAITKLKKLVTEERVDPALTWQDLEGAKTASVFRDLINREITSALTPRNYGKAKKDHLTFHPIFNFEYRDGARMMTFGGLVHLNGQADEVDRMKLDQLEWYCNDPAKTFDISLPVVTARERRQLEMQLPGVADPDLQPPWLGTLAGAEYRRAYRFAPNYLDIDF